jgi:hypothetical protein
MKKNPSLYRTNLCYFGAPFYEIQTYDLFEYIHRLRFYPGGVSFGRTPMGQTFATADEPYYTINGTPIDSVFDGVIELEYDFDCFAWITMDL